MDWFTKLYLRLRHDDRGATMVEYVVLTGLIAVALVTAITALSTDLTETFTFVGQQLDGARGGGGGGGAP